MHQLIERGATSQIVHVFIGDSSVATGAGLTAAAYNSLGLAGRVIRAGETLSSALTFEDVSAIGTYQAPSSNAHLRIKEIDGANLPGWYELHLPNAWLNTTGNRRSLVVQLRGVANMRPTSVDVQLIDPIRGLGSPTALPGAAAEGAGGLFTRGTGAGQIEQGVNGTIVADLRRIDGLTTLDHSAILRLKQIDVYNSSGNAVQFTADSASGDFHGLFARGCNRGIGVFGMGGGGTAGSPATAGAGIQGMGGSSWDGSEHGQPQAEWGGPGIRGVGGDRGTPGVTCKAGPGGPALFIFIPNSGPANAPAVRISANANPNSLAVEMEAGSLADALIRCFGGSTSANVVKHAEVGQGVFFASPPNVDVEQISGDAGAADNAESFFDGTGYSCVNSSIPKIGSLQPAQEFVCQSAGANSIQFTVDSAPMDRKIIGWTLVEITNGLPQIAYIEDYDPLSRTASVRLVGATGGGDWPTPPSPGDRFNLFSSSSPPLLELIALYLGDLITQNPGLVWEAATSDHQNAGSTGKALSRLAAIQAKTDALGAGQITTTAPVAPDGEQILVVHGDDYSAADGRALAFQEESSGWPDLAGATVRLSIRFTESVFQTLGSVTSPSGPAKSVQFELTAADTSTFEIRKYCPFDVEAELTSGRKITLVLGRCTILADAKS